jgi:N-acetylneuraminic acid mutarotase
MFGALTRATHRPGTAALLATLALTACQDDPVGPQPAEPSPAPELALSAMVTSNTWYTGLNSMPTRRFDLVTATIGGRVYAIGGRHAHYGVFSQVEAYTPAYSSIDGRPFSGLWETKASLPAARWGASGAAVINGKIYVPGGSADIYSRTSLSENTLFEYDPVANSWATRAPMPVKTCCGASVNINNKLYVFTPALVNGSPMLHRYNPVTNRWARMAGPPHDHGRPVGGAINGKFYLVGGQDGTLGPAKFLDVYNPATNSWVTRKAAPTARYGAAGRALNGKLYVIGGRGVTDVALNTVEAYDPVSNTWSTKAPIPTARYYLGIGQLSGFLFALGGWQPGGTDYRGLNTNEAYYP